MGHTDTGRRTAFRAVVVLLLATALLLAGQSAEARQRGRFRVTMSLSATSIAPGGTVVASGTVSPAKVGKRILLQANYGQGWERAAGGRILPGGSYRITDRPATARDRIYRVVVPGTRRIRKGVSSTALLKIRKKRAATPTPAPAYKWYDLYDLTPVDYRYVYTVSSVRINGGYFTKSVYDADPWNDNAFREYNLSRLCTQLTTTAGLSDESETGALAEIRLLRDSNEVYRHQFALGQSAALSLDMTNTLRLRIEMTSLNSAYAYGALGSPRVYCKTSIEAGMDE